MGELHSTEAISGHRRHPVETKSGRSFQAGHGAWLAVHSWRGGGVIHSTACASSTLCPLNIDFTPVKLAGCSRSAVPSIPDWAASTALGAASSRAGTYQLIDQLQLNLAR